MTRKSSSSKNSKTTPPPPITVLVRMDAIDEPPVPLRSKIDQDKISELADSMQARGLLQPILLRERKDRYQIIAGHRRFLAAKLLNWNQIVATVKICNEAQSHLDAIAENLHREDLTPLEEARLVYDLHYNDKLEPAPIARLLNRGLGWVQSRLDLYFMPEYLKEELDAKRISMAVARELMEIQDEDHRRYLVGMAVQFGCSLRMAQSWVQQRRAEQPMLDAIKADPAQHEPITRLGEVKMPCWFCSSPTPLPILSIVRFCPDCLLSADKVRQGHVGGSGSVS